MTPSLLLPSRRGRVFNPALSPCHEEWFLPSTPEQCCLQGRGDRRCPAAVTWEPSPRCRAEGDAWGKALTQCIMPSLESCLSRKQTGPFMPALWHRLWMQIPACPACPSLRCMRRTGRRCVREACGRGQAPTLCETNTDSFIPCLLALRDPQRPGLNRVLWLLAGRNVNNREISCILIT